MTLSLTYPIDQVRHLSPKPASAGLVTQSLAILVGVTGTGKSTTLGAIKESGLKFTMLPDRRTLTDQFIIPTVAQWDEQPEQTFCRIERLKCTRRYRERFPGGMAHVLTQLRVDPQTESRFIFDGLRGENEVSYAAKAFPRAKFVVLEASDRARLQRLLLRQDTFDRTAPSQATVGTVEQNLDNFTTLGIPEASRLFEPGEEQKILDWARNGHCCAAELRDKLKIVVAERRNYDPDTTRAALEAIAPERTLAIDTTLHSPQAIAQTVLKFMFNVNVKTDG